MTEENTNDDFDVFGAAEGTYAPVQSFEEYVDLALATFEDAPPEVEQYLQEISENLVRGFSAIGDVDVRSAVAGLDLGIQVGQAMGLPFADVPCKVAAGALLKYYLTHGDTVRQA